VKRIRSSKPSSRQTSTGLSRREFATRAGVAAAALAANPGALLGSATATAVTAAVTGAALQEPASSPKLSRASQAEVDAKVAEIFRRYGDKLNDEQKADIRRLVHDGQAPLEALRAYALDNSDEPATVLHLVGVPPRRAASAPAVATPAAGKKPAGGGA
jgi:hypothetical protein